MPLSTQAVRRLGTTMRQLEVAAQVIGGLRAAGVQTLLLKGAALIDVVYTADERPMLDVDILVRRSDFELASSWLLREGFRRLVNLERPYTYRVFHERAFVSPDGVNVDLHADLDEPRRWRIDTEELFKRAVPAAVPGAERLCTEDTIVHLAIHAAKEEFGIKTHAAGDLTRLIAATEIDWDLVVERSQRWRCQTVVWMALLTTQGTKDADIPTSILRRLRPNAARRAYLLALLDPTQQPAERFGLPTRTRQILLRLPLLDGWEQRLRDGVITSWRWGVDKVAHGWNP